ncbi:hypothetical protein C798_00075 [Herbaspirillum rubrisubalbicans Os34]|uniref:Uncharacterized protein n=1 Tax=Herbaspirillum rubrisubalbicans Os34 TaxID=1235827 RepID=A0A6M3ZMD5_9BURK|nr:hypothetical protein [Herbaspirillum rubrisubalbicans]QJP98681.1 hypothetical protein C798_00075 [Herbaspirillum rubrisubalbicans Os34]
MAFELVRALAATERNDDFHIARLLLQLKAGAGRDGKKPMDGFTKLAKLDFLLRYPNCLERALVAEGGPVDAAKVQDFERTSIESKMIRFRYGPWDHRYRRWVSIMVARGLVHVDVVGKTVKIWLTEQGLKIAESVSESEAYRLTAERAALINAKFGSKSGVALKDFVYKTFPELTSMKWGEEIAL